MKKNILDRVKMLFETVSTETSTEDNFKDVKTEDDRILRVDGDTVAIDATIKEVTEDGVIDLEDGSYKLAEEDGKILTITVASGVITDVAEEDAPESDTPEVTTGEDSENLKKTFKAIAKFAYDATKFAIIKQIYKYEMTVDQDDFSIGTAVTMTYEYEGETTTYAAYAGTYELEDGRMITLNDEGVVVLITDASGIVIEAPEVGDSTDGSGETAPADTTASVDEETMSKVLDAFESLQEKYANLTKEFEAFKKAPSAKHTDLKIDFNSEETKPLKRPRTPLDAVLGR